MINFEQSCMKIRWGLTLLIIGILAIACIGFFVFTATVSSPTTMRLFMSRDSGKDSADQYSGVKTKLTLILLKDDKVFGYYKDSIKGGRLVSLDETDKLIADGREMFSNDSLIVVIKPSDSASYKATVFILDKMSLNKIDKYSMNDLNRREKEFLKLTE